jgi:hypothetical protein
MKIKKQKGMSPFSTFNNGDPKLNSDMFNHSAGSDAIAGSVGTVESYRITEHSTRGMYNYYRWMLSQAWRDPETTIAYNADDSLCEAIIDIISKPNMGGMIILSTDVNAVKLSENKLVNWVKQKIVSVENKFAFNKKLTKLASKHKDIFAWSIGRYFHGRYRSKEGYYFDEKSLSIEILGVPVKILIELAEDLCREFKQEAVMLKDYANDRVLFIDAEKELPHRDYPEYDSYHESIKKRGPRNIFEPVDNREKNNTAGMGEDIDMNNVDITDMGEAFRTLNKLDEQKLNEASLKRFETHLEKGNPMAILSADKGYRTKSQNKINEQELKHFARMAEIELAEGVFVKSKFGYMRAKGGYVEANDDGITKILKKETNENSIILIADKSREKELFDFATAMGERYDQESVLLIPSNGNAYYLSTNTDPDNWVGGGELYKKKPIGRNVYTDDEHILNAGGFTKIKKDDFVIAESFELNYDFSKNKESVSRRMGTQLFRNYLKKYGKDFLKEWEKEQGYRIPSYATESIDNTYDALKALNKLDE